MAVLRRPCVIPLRFVAFAQWYHRSLFLFSYLLMRPERWVHIRPGRLRLSPDGRPCHYSRWNSPGLPGSWEVLSCLCPALRPRPRLTALPFRQFGVAPDGQTTKAATITISGLNHTASALAVYASRFGFPTLARLASGRVAALTGWVSNPLDFNGEFQSGPVAPDIPTPQALPGATMFDVRLSICSSHLPIFCASVSPRSTLFPSPIAFNQ